MINKAKEFFIECEYSSEENVANKQANKIFNLQFDRDNLKFKRF